MIATARPTLEEVRKDMGAPSTREVRGQRDTVGYATTSEAMAKVWDLSAQGPEPESFGAKIARRPRRHRPARRLHLRRARLSRCLPAGHREDRGGGRRLPSLSKVRGARPAG